MVGPVSSDERTSFSTRKVREEPVSRVLAKVLGPAEGLRYDFIARMDAKYGPLRDSWGFSGGKYGWSFRLKQKKRTVLYLIPQKDMFLIGIVLGDRALGLLRKGNLAPDFLRLIEEAPRYGKGTGFRIPVAKAEDCADLEIVIEARMALFPPQNPERGD